MQWLIDIIIDLMWESIYSRGIYRDRGTYAGPDFSETDLTQDQTWRDLDLSGIIEPNAKCVVIRLKCWTSAVPKFMRFRQKGTTMGLHTCEFRTQVAGMENNAQFVIGVDENRICQYWIQTFAWESIGLNVRGWFM